MPQVWERQLALLHHEASPENRAVAIFQVQRANPEPTGEPRPAVSERVQALSPSSPGARRALTLRILSATQPAPCSQLS